MLDIARNKQWKVEYIDLAGMVVVVRTSQDRLVLEPSLTRLPRRRLSHPRPSFVLCPGSSSSTSRLTSWQSRVASPG